MHKLSFINYCPQHKQPKAMCKSRISAIKMAIPAYLRLFTTMGQSTNRFYAHNTDPKIGYGHKLSNKSLRSHVKETHYLIVLITLITNTTRQKIILQLCNMTFCKEQAVLDRVMLSLLTKYRLLNVAH